VSLVTFVEIPFSITRVIILKFIILKITEIGILNLQGSCASSRLPMPVKRACVSQSYSAAVDKLVTVSKIFADQRVSELLAENRELRLQLFWKDYGVTHLQEAMRNANQKTGGPDCSCLACAVSGRMDSENEARGFECSFKPHFEALLVECGLESLNGGGMAPHMQHMSNSSGNCVYDQDTHLIRIGRDDWFAFTYGSRLFKAVTASDPELLKLRNLFDKLDYDADSDEEAVPA
jgi:hypothetical protein